MRAPPCNLMVACAIALPVWCFRLSDPLFALFPRHTNQDIAHLPQSLCRAHSRSSRSTTVLYAVGLFEKSKHGDFKTIMELPANAVKIEALRFFLQLYLVGRQNDPTSKAWLTQQSEKVGANTGSDGLQVYFHDGTGMLSIKLQQDGISMARYGERPSLLYQLQESVLLHGILDELDDVVNGRKDSDGNDSSNDTISAENRLLTLVNGTSIDDARRSLPARRVS
jgi:hypothetical protein